MTSVKRDGENVVITLPRSEIHGLRVALAPCPCKASKSTATATIRERLDKALALMETRK